jgi:hypothetical protein
MTKDPVATATGRLHALGQSLWINNITRGLLTAGTLQWYIEEWSVGRLLLNRLIPKRVSVLRSHTIESPPCRLANHGGLAIEHDTFGHQVDRGRPAREHP